MEISNLFNLEAEKNLIGAVILNNDKLCDVIDQVKPDDFYNDKHKLIYSTVVKLYENSKPVNITTIAEVLGNNLIQAGGITYISELVNSTLPTENVKAYGDIVKEKSNIRNLNRVLRTNISKIEKENVKSEDLAKELQEAALNIETKTSSDDGNLEEAMINVLDMLETRYRNGGAIQGVPTGFTKLDRTLNGLNKSDLIIIAARPSMGKTAFAVNLASNSAKNAKVSLFSLEMSKEQILERVLASRSLIHMDSIKKGQLKDEEWGRVSRISSLVVSSGLKIYDEIFTLNGIKAECKKRKLQEGLDVVIIDYLTLIDGAAKAENRNQEITKLSRQLKLMAKELDVTVISLAQLSRAPEARKDHRPMLSDLRESGSIEQDADIVMFLYRDEYYNPETEDKNIIENIIAKHRNGAIGTLKFSWRPEYQLITETYGGV